MLDRRRTVILVWAGACAALFLLLAFMVHLQRAPLGALDDMGRSAEQWASARPGVQSLLRGIEIAFGTVGMTIWTILIAVPLFARGHRRAAVFTVGVMISTSLLTAAIKAFYGRDRPTWQDPVGSLTSKSFPSGHASSAAALAGILIVLAIMLIRNTVLRRTVYASAVLVALVVGLDRVFLGRHYPTDVIAGWLLGSCVVLLWLSFYSPLPHSHAETAQPLAESMPSDPGSR